jgi:hypothetical protein
LQKWPRQRHAKCQNGPLDVNGRHFAARADCAPSPDREADYLAGFTNDILILL